ncbi:MAG TPA: hypothetical protein VFO16_07940, partial [Pseudonocardiaceae bacterium]|nr:hypothetical protein [Pseudonocardiaceae bacterium]
MTASQNGGVSRTFDEPVTEADSAPVKGWDFAWSARPESSLGSFRPTSGSTARTRRVIGTIKYYIWISWPVLPMAAAPAVGFALGLATVFWVITPTSELQVNPIALGIMGGRPGSNLRLARLLDRRARMLGYDVPERVEATVTEVTQEDLALAELVREAQAALRWPRHSYARGPNHAELFTD